MPKVVAVDLDGTLLRSDGSLSRRTIAALRLVMAAGARVVVVTARPPRFARQLVEDAGLVDPLVCSNGAIVYHPDPLDELADRIEVVGPLDPRIASQAAAALLAELPEMTFAVETGWQAFAGPGYDHQATRESARSTVASLERLWTVPEGMVKLLAWSAAQVTDELLERVTRLLPQVTVTYSGGHGMIEISSAGVSKVGTLRRLCDGWGVTAAQVIAFGDMPNDLPVLNWAGQAVAMANAHAQVKEAADLVTRSNDEDGVAVVLEEMFATLGVVVPAG